MELSFSQIICFIFLFHITQSCVAPDDLVGARAPGDVIIGGIFPVHTEVLNLSPERPEAPKCVGFDVRGFLLSLAMIHAIKTINNSTLLPNIKLGYEIYDTCSEATMAARVVLKMLADPSNHSVPFQCNYTDYKPRIKAVVGATYSEIAITVSRMLNLQLIPQVSSSSTAEILSDKNRYPSFVRTVPHDLYQTRAMAQLIGQSGWNWIGVIYTDDDYGRFAIESFISEATKQNICIAFQEVLPAYLSDDLVHSRIKQTSKKVADEKRVNVVVVFAKAAHVSKLFEDLIQMKVNKTWIASDSWSRSSKVFSVPNVSKVGKVIGFTFRSGNISTFHNYLKKLKIDYNSDNRFIREFKMLVSNCSDAEESDLCRCNSVSSQDNPSVHECFMSSAEPAFVYSTLLAVKSVAHAIKDLCKVDNCNNSFEFAPWQLLNAIKKVNFTDDGRSIYFQKGDSNLGYDVIIWKAVGGTIDPSNIVAEYNLEKQDFFFENEAKKQELKSLQKIQSNCSDECKPGERKTTAQSPHTCCYDCEVCSENQFTNETDMDHCLDCNNKTHWSPVNSSTCFEKTTEFLKWSDWYAIVLVAISALGIVLALAVGALFAKNLNTPVVKASGGPLCFIILICLCLSFVSAMFFIGNPIDFQCKIRQVLFGISFSLCVSCILLKSFKILIAFNFDLTIQKRLKRLYNPYIIVIICTGIQVIICIAWLVSDGPHVYENHLIPKIILLECSEGSNVGFGLMLGYIAVLALICFIFAFKGRKLPESYNEAKFITFGMLIYFISWISFVPVYVTTFGKYLPAVEMIVILISNYGILCCHFFPKCYIILFKKEFSTKSAFQVNVFNYTLRSASNLPVGQMSLDDDRNVEPRLSITSINSEKPLFFISDFQKHKVSKCESYPSKDEVLFNCGANTGTRKRLTSV
ncbi:G-protein coupled receptor family C group 6 member A [Latimeria chalumnae]|uniref:G-protein coupled receptor family C group 6 member A n=1 Tax=Latimeria chalumnae TaxID=7897 RepID=H3AMQ5_LATCH